MSENQENDNNMIEEEFEDEDELDRIPLEDDAEEMSGEVLLPAAGQGQSAKDGNQGETEHPGYGMGMTAMILGILSLLFFCIPVAGMVLAAFAIVLGIVSAAKRNGKKMGTSGIIMGGISLVSYLVIILLFGGLFQLFDQNRDHLTDRAWRRTTDGSVLYLYADGTFIDVEREGVFSDDFYSGTYDILSYEDAGLSFGSLEDSYDTRYAYDVCLYVDTYVTNGEKRENIADTIRYLYFFEKNYETGDAVSVCAHDLNQYGTPYPVKETDLLYPSLDNQYMEQTGTDGEDTDWSEEDTGTGDIEPVHTEEPWGTTEVGTMAEGPDSEVPGTEMPADSTSEGSTGEIGEENHFWGGIEDFLDTSKKELEEFSSSASESWEENSEAVSSAAEEVSSALEEAGSALEEAGSSMEEMGSSAAEELGEKLEENGIRKAFRNLIQWIKDILSGWGF